MTNLLTGLEARRGTTKNRLLYGDNLTVMQGMNSASVDLIYLDPPFNSQRTYNLIYRQLTGAPLPEQEEAFCDAWAMDEEKEQMARNMPVVLKQHDVPESLIVFWKAWIDALRNSQPRLLAYLIYMSYRLLEMRRILKPTGSLFLHCDPAASHYIKVILDSLFGHENFRNEIIWKRTSAHSSARRCGPVHDTIFFYTKSDRYTWNNLYQKYDDGYIETFYNHVDPDGRRWRRSDLTGAGTRNGETGKPWRGVDVTSKGRHWAWPPSVLDEMDAEGKIHWPKKVGGIPMLKRYLDEQPGMPLQDIWTDIPPIHALSPERLGYQTQKPLPLLERIIAMASNEGDVVFDPFCGCGTTIYAAQKAKRRWIGCDIAILSIRIVREVLHARYGVLEGHHYEVSGVPLTVEGAQDLFGRDPRQFEHWVVELAGGFPSNKASNDRGIDGSIWFETGGQYRRTILSVKGGKLRPDFMRELRGTLARESDNGNADMGGLICLQEPTAGMRREAAEAGMFTYKGIEYPRLQIRTVAELLDGRGFQTPSRVKTLGWEMQPSLALEAAAPTKARRRFTKGIAAAI